jgi:hypothetical protein
MALNGNLSTMPLPDVLQWIAASRASGTLTVENGRITKRIAVQGGRVTGCSTDDPPALLGQFLLSRGKIEREHLKEALERQEQEGKNIGEILIDMEVLTRESLSQSLRAKAEDVIFGLFDWEEAVFRFENEVEPDRYQIQVDLDVQEILLRGLERQDQMQRFRGVFTHDGVVLSKTDTPPPAEVMQSRMASRVLDSVNGERTLAEVILHTHASEFLVTKFLFQLHRIGVIRVNESREEASEEAAVVHEIVVDDGTAAASVVGSAVEDVLGGAAPPSTDSAEVPKQGIVDDAEPGDTVSGAAEPAPVESEEMVAAATAPAPDAPSPTVTESSPQPPSTANADLAAELAVAMRFMERGEHEAALEMLNASYRAHPLDATIRHLITQCEAAVEKKHTAELAPEKVPHLLKPAEELAEHDLSAEASFLPSLIDGKTDIKSILWLAPMRTVDVMRALKQMIEAGLIELKDPAGAQAKSA